jgi:hypothetical protein
LDCSPQTCLRDYGHLFDEFDAAKRKSAEAVITPRLRARTSLVPLETRKPSLSRS